MYFTVRIFRRYHQIAFFVYGFRVNTDEYLRVHVCIVEHNTHIFLLWLIPSANLCPEQKRINIWIGLPFPGMGRRVCRSIQLRKLSDLC